MLQKQLTQNHIKKYTFLSLLKLFINVSTHLLLYSYL